MSSFNPPLDQVYQEKVVRRLEKTVRETALLLDAELVRTTPVDTGRARSNWLPTLNEPSNATTSSTTPAGQIASVAAGYRLGDTILLTNNLPYIKRLNEGWSKQAPSGFVDAAIARVRRMVGKAVKS